MTQLHSHGFLCTFTVAHDRARAHTHTHTDIYLGLHVVDYVV